MADEEKESTRRKVRRVEMMQVASAVAVGLMLLPLVVENLAYYWWWWTALAFIALYGAIRPLFIETTQLRARFFEVIGEERGAEFLDQLYKYTRGEPIPVPAPPPAMPEPQIPIAKSSATAESAPPPPQA
jgi:hypothetical protein